MKEYDSTGNTGRFLGLFSVLINAAFAYAGVELVAVAAGEAANPRKNIPRESISFSSPMRYMLPLLNRCLSISDRSKVSKKKHVSYS
jgi:amino acid permease